jgi:hypothetical protein
MRSLKPDVASRKAAMPPSLSWKFTEKEFTEQVKDVKLFVKCIQAITLNHPPLLCGFASLREISMSDFRRSRLTKVASFFSREFVSWSCHESKTAVQSSDICQGITRNVARAAFAQSV